MSKDEELYAIFREAAVDAGAIFRHRGDKGPGTVALKHYTMACFLMGLHPIGSRSSAMKLLEGLFRMGYRDEFGELFWKEAGLEDSGADTTARA